MKLIPLSNTNNCKNKGKYFAKVDDEDFEYLNQWNWCASKEYSPKHVYAARHQMENGKRVGFRMSRVLLGVNDPLVYVDHIDHDTLNNQKYNLRKCTNAQNQMNKTACGRSKYLGVSLYKGTTKYFHKGTNMYKTSITIRWKAQICVNGKKIALGHYLDEKLAAIAYNIAAQKHFGEFANLNIIPEQALTQLNRLKK